VKSVCLWTAYISFDFVIVLASSIVTVIIFRGVSNQWYHLEYLFVVFFCFGLASTLLSYVISLVARSQLAAFAIAAGYQALVYLPMLSNSTANRTTVSCFYSISSPTLVYSRTLLSIRSTTTLILPTSASHLSRLWGALHGHCLFHSTSFPSFAVDTTLLPIPGRSPFTAVQYYT